MQLQGQWSQFIIRVKLMKKAWKPYGVDINMKASGLKNVKLWNVNDDTKNRQSRK